MKKLLPIVLLMAGIAAAQAGSVSADQSLAARERNAFSSTGTSWKNPRLGMSGIAGESMRT